MDLRQIAVFKSVYEAGSIVGAAELERCAPSVIAHHLVNLEHRLAQTLFERSSRGAVPTPGGQQFYPHAVAILRSIENATNDMLETTMHLTGRVTLGMAFSAVYAVGLPLIQEVTVKQPGIQLELAESVSGATIERLLAADIDLALAYNPPRDPRLSLTPILEEDMMCLGKPELVGNPNTPMPLKQFLGLKYILTRKGPRGRPITNNTETQKLLEANASLFSENVTAAQLFVNNGSGVMLGTQSNLQHKAFNSDIVGRDISEPKIARTLYFCERRDAPMSKPMAFVRDSLLALIGQEISSGRWECRSLYC